MQSLFEPEQLRRMQASWRRAQAPARELWHEAKKYGEGQFEGNGLYYKNLPPGHGVERFQKLAHGRLFFDIPVEDFFSEARDEDGDPVLLDTIAPSRLVPVLDAILGGDVRLLTVQARTVPSEVEGGYTSWHRGLPTSFLNLQPCYIQHRSWLINVVVPMQIWRVRLTSGHSQRIGK